MNSLALCLAEDHLLSVYREVLDLAANWMDVGLVLGLRYTYLEEISATYPEKPRECLKKALAQWLKQAYNVGENGLPTWKKIVEVTADPIAGNNPALAAALAQNHQGMQHTACNIDRHLTELDCSKIINPILMIVLKSIMSGD